MVVVSRRLMMASRWWKAGIALLVVVVGLQLWKNAEAPPLSAKPQTLLPTYNHQPPSNETVHVASTSMKSLVPGELPGYTGWSRPEHTLAGYFQILSISTKRGTSHDIRVGDDLEIVVVCQGHSECSNSETSELFLRAYGPSVIAGRATTTKAAKEKYYYYTLTFRFLDPGPYTVEVVLTFSNPQSIDKFPLPYGEPASQYEGFLLPGFPLQLHVQQQAEGEISKSNKKSFEASPLCTLEDLTETSPTSALYKARWKVTRKSNGPGYSSATVEDEPAAITGDGYKNNIHSFGIHMDYEYSSKCRLLPPDSLAQCGNVDKQPFQKQPIQIIFIGDSVMRVQKVVFDDMVQQYLPKNTVQTSYINLYGGYRRHETIGPTILTHLQDIQRRYPDDPKAILFNTGLHDIHRLCAGEWKQDRYEYMAKDVLDSGNFRCVQEYRTLLQDFAKLLKTVPAELKVFQSTTAAWPKYGNFNIEWNVGAQVLPLEACVVARFNDVAFDVLKDYHDQIRIVDGYWITYSRPDNREIGDIGHKLSHPGLEVQSVMARIWSMLIVETLCPKP